MKKTLTLLFVLSLFTGILQAQVIFDPATYPEDSLKNGMEIVDLGGTQYLKVPLNAWSTLFPLYNTTVAPMHNMITTEFAYKVGNDTYTADQIYPFFKMVNTQGEEMLVIKPSPPANPEFTRYSAEADIEGDTLLFIQLAGQENQSWSAVVGDTIYLGKVMAMHPYSLLDPLLVEPDSLPSGWSVDTIGGLGYFRVELDGWNSFWQFYQDMDSVTIPENVKAYKAMARYSVGQGGFELGNINTFLKFSDPSWTEIPSPIGKPSSADFTKYNGTIEPGATLGIFQVAGQETQSWSAVTGDTLWVGMVTGEHADSLKLTSEGDATTIDTNGGTLQMTAWLYPEDLAIQTVTWSSSDEEVATVDGNGLVTAVWNGEATIKAMADDGSGLSEQMTITVSNQVVLIESIAVAGEGDATSIDTPGGTLQMVATVSPGEADGEAIEWSVEPGEVASIDASGLLTALENGTATVTATATDGSEVTGSADITITGQNTGMESPAEGTLSIYPNPAEDILYIEHSGGLTGLEIVDLNGRQVLSLDPASQKIAVDVSGLRNGVYFVRSFSGDQAEVYKLVK